MTNPVIDRWMAKEGEVVPGYDKALVVAPGTGRRVGITADIGFGNTRR
jgi:hypothetical protein